MNLLRRHHDAARVQRFNNDLLQATMETDPDAPLQYDFHGNSAAAVSDVGAAPYSAS